MIIVWRGQVRARQGRGLEARVTLHERRAMVEILLCGDLTGCLTSAINLGEPRELARRCAVIEDPGFTFQDSGLEAAYRLIEASPTLVREFFGSEIEP